MAAGQVCEGLDAVSSTVDLVAAVLQGSGEGFSHRAVVVNDENVHAHGLTSSVGGCAVGSASERGSGTGPAVGVGSAAAWGSAAAVLGGGGALGGLGLVVSRLGLPRATSLLGALPGCLLAFLLVVGGTGRRRHLCQTVEAGLVRGWSRFRGDGALGADENSVDLAGEPANQATSHHLGVAGRGVDAQAGGLVDGNGVGKQAGLDGRDDEAVAGKGVVVGGDG